MHCEGGKEGHEFGDGGDDVVGLHRYVLCDIGGGADGCASGDEACSAWGMCSVWATVRAALNAAVPGVPYT